MRTQLDDVAERGEPVAALIAAEYPIYGRYGYGPATEAITLRVDTAAASWRDDAVGAVELVDAETWAKIVGGAVRPGAGDGARAPPARHALLAHQRRPRSVSVG